MKWQKLGKIFENTGISQDLVSHSSNPAPIYLSKDKIRIFYSGRNLDNKSSISFIDFDLKNLEVCYIHKEAILTYGDSNSYYSDGITLGTPFKLGRNIRIPFMGWKLSGLDHWQGELGLAQLTKEKTLIIPNGIPIISCKSKNDPISVSYGCAFRTPLMWIMVYGSTLKWESPETEMVHPLKVATSKNGLRWNTNDSFLPYAIGDFQAMSHPTVFKIKELPNVYNMLFSYRGKKGDNYLIGYAHSIDGLTWNFDIGGAGIEPSKNGWDSEMIEYPTIFNYNADTFLLYNGNGFGASGIGLAKLER